jgi:hypothetical protein
VSEFIALGRLQLSRRMKRGHLRQEEQGKTGGCAKKMQASEWTDACVGDSGLAFSSFIVVVITLYVVFSGDAVRRHLHGRAHRALRCL